MGQTRAGSVRLGIAEQRGCQVGVGCSVSETHRCRMLSFRSRLPRRSKMLEVAIPAGLEPATRGVEIRYSIQLSYGTVRAGAPRGWPVSYHGTYEKSGCPPRLD